MQQGLDAMAHTNSAPSDIASEASKEQDAGRNGAGHTPAPGAPAAGAETQANQTGGASGDKAPRSRSERAEEIADRIAVKVATITSLFGRKLIQVAAHVREAASDFWAEVQDVRHHKDKQ
jgi:hypothetical protein